MALSRAERRFIRRYSALVLTASAVIALGISAAVLPYYSSRNLFVSAGQFILSTSVQNSTETVYSLEGLRTVFVDSAGFTTSSYSTWRSAGFTTLPLYFRAVQAFIIIAVISAAFVGILSLLLIVRHIRVAIVDAIGRGVLKSVHSISSLLVFASVAISLFVVIGLPTAFTSEFPSCSEGYCRSFFDRRRVEYGASIFDVSSVALYVWGPNEGWWLNLAALPISFILAVLSIITSFPLSHNAAKRAEVM